MDFKRVLEDQMMCALVDGEPAGTFKFKDVPQAKRAAFNEALRPLRTRLRCDGDVLLECVARWKYPAVVKWAPTAAYFSDLAKRLRALSEELADNLEDTGLYDLWLEGKLGAETEEILDSPARLLDRQAAVCEEMATRLGKRKVRRDVLQRVGRLWLPTYVQARSGGIHPHFIVRLLRAAGVTAYAAQIRREMGELKKFHPLCYTRLQERLR